MADVSARGPELGTFFRRGLAAASLGAGAIHAATAFDHGEHQAQLTFFVAVAVLQVAWGLMILLRRWSVPALAAGAVLNAGVVVVWLLSRTVGLSGIPGGEQREPVGLADGIASGLEVVLVVAVAGLAPAAGRRLALASAPLLSWLAVAGVGALTVAGLAAPSHHQQKAGHSHRHGDPAATGGAHDEVAHTHDPAEVAAGPDHAAAPGHTHAVHAGGEAAHAGGDAIPHGAPGHVHFPGHVHPETGVVEGEDHGTAHDHVAAGPDTAASDHPHDGAGHDHANDPGHAPSEGGGHDHEGGGDDHEGGHDHCSEGGGNPVLSQLQEAAHALGLGCVYR